MSAHSSIAATLLLLATSGCALTSKSDSVILRYFTPERVGQRTAPPQPSVASATPLQLHLGRVAAASYLRERIAFRDSDYEVGFYDDLRWTERPEAYVRRAMIRGLFEDQPLQQVVTGAAPTLDVDLSAFEELRTPTHTARVEITWTLYNDHAVLVQKTLLAERPIVESKTSTGPAAVAIAMSDALADAVKQVVSGTMTALATIPSPVAPAVPTEPLPLPPTKGRH